MTRRTPLLGTSSVPSSLWRFLLLSGLACFLLWWWTAPPGGGTQSLAGVWPASIQAGDSTETRHLSIPVVFDLAGIDSLATVRWDIPISLTGTESELGVLLQRPRHSALLDWDGEVIGGIGDFGQGADSGRANRVLLSSIPPRLAGAGAHRLGITVRGAFGDGGLVRAVQFGDLENLKRLSHRHEVLYLGLAVLLAFASMIHLLLASMRTQRSMFLGFGFFCGAVSICLFAQSEAWYLLSENLEWKLRFRFAGACLGTAFAVVVPAQFAGKTESREVRTIVAVGVLLAALELAWPDPAMIVPVGRANHVLVAVVMVASVWYLVRASREGQWQASAALGLAAVGVLGAIGEILAQRGAVNFNLVIVPTLAVFVLGMSVVLIRGRMDFSDRYAQVVASARDGIVLVSPDGRVLEANPALVSLLGEGEGHLLGDLVDPEERVGVEAYVAEGESGRLLEFRLSAEGPR